MNLYARGSLGSGNYRPVGHTTDGEIIAVHEFGIGPGQEPGVVTRALARYVLELQDNFSTPLKIVGTAATDRALRAETEGSHGVFYPVEGNSSSYTGEGLGTVGEIAVLKRAMEGKGLQTAILVGQASHIGRVGLQARKLGIPNYVIPPDLPNMWAPQSSQLWTRGRLPWALHELLGVPVLRLRKYKTLTKN